MTCMSNNKNRPLKSILPYTFPKLCTAKMLSNILLYFFVMWLVTGYIEEACIIPCPSDCKLSEWSNWSRCSKSCGSGVKVRSKWLREKPYNGGRPCPKLDHVNQVREGSLKVLYSSFVPIFLDNNLNNAVFCCFLVVFYKWIPLTGSSK